MPLTDDSVLAVFPDAKPQGDGWMVPCPAHPDDKASVSIGTGDHGTPLVHCFAGCPNEAIAAALNLTEGELYRALEQGAPSSARRPPRPAKVHKPRTAAKLALRKAVRVSRKSGEFTHRYVYTDEQSAPLYRVVRVDRPDGGKDFYQERFLDGEWQSGLGDIRRVLYRLAHLTGRRRVFWVEGEKCVRALVDAGLTATTTCGGAGGFQTQHHYAEQLKACGVELVVILPDNDAPGRAYADAVARACHAAGLTVRVLVLPDLPEKGDIVDWFASGRTREDLKAAAKAVPTYEPPLVADPTASLVGTYVYVVRLKKFIHLETFQALDKEQLDAAHAADFPLQSRGSRPASVVFLNNPRAQRVDIPTYRPKGERVLLENGLTALNLYRPTLLTPEPGDVDLWLDLFAHVVPDEFVRETLLDFCAFLAQFPEKKPNWAPLIGSVPGVGKDSIFLPVQRAVGEHNVALITPADLEGSYTSWLKGTKLVVVEEMASFGKRALMNQLKPLLAAPPDRLYINEKFVPQYYLPNLAAFIFFSNHRHALALEPGDRRFLVYWSPATPQPPAVYKEFYRWLPTNEGAVYAWLLARDLSLFNAEGHAPMTADKVDAIDSSRSSLEQFVRTLVEARERPFADDLVVLQRVLTTLPYHAAHGVVTLHALGRTLRGVGARELRQLRLSNGARPRCWAVRRADLYAAMSEKALTKAFVQQAANRGRAFPRHDDVKAAEDEG